MLPKGKFIVFEGLDRSGKSSLCRYVNKKLADRGASKIISFPNRATAVGQMINEFLLNKAELNNEAIHLLFSANRWENMKEI